MTGGKTKQITVTDAADVAVTAQTFCKRILVREDPVVVASPTNPYTVKAPLSTDQAIGKFPAEEHEFRAPSCYEPGDVAGYIRLTTAATSTTFAQVEA